MIEEVLETDPRHPEANFRLGLARIQLGEPHLAVWPLERAAEEPDFRVASGLLLTTAYQQTQSFESAVSAATRVLDQVPDHVGALALRAVARESARDLEGALADAEAILRIDPDQFQGLLIRARALTQLNRVEEAEPALVTLHEAALASDDPAAGAACLFLPHFLANRRGDIERAEATSRACLAAFPDDLVVVSDVLNFLEARGKGEEVTQTLRELVERDPRNLRGWLLLAHRLRAVGEGEQAAELLREGAETIGTSEAWRALASFHLTEDDLEAALAASEEALAIDPENESLRFFHAEVLVENGRADEAEALARELEEPAYRHLVDGHVQLARGNPRAAQASLERGLALWPNHPGARQLAAQAALALGDFEQAASHLLEAVRATDGASPAVVDLARLELAGGDAERALHFAQMGAKHPQTRMASHLLAAQAAARLGDTKAAREWLAPLLGVPEQRSAAVIALAAVEQQENGPAAAVRVLEESELDFAAPENERALRVWVESLIDAGRGEAALARVRSVLEQRPEEASLHDLLGRALLRLDRHEEARAAFEHALALDAKDAHALEGLALAHASAGELEPAIALLERATEADPEEERYLYTLAQLLRRAGRDDEAQDRLIDAVQRFPGAAGARNDLAWLLTEQGVDLDYAEQLASRAVRIDPNPAYLDTLGWVQYRRGKIEAALGALERAARADPDSAVIQYHLGVVRAAAGQAQAAKAALERALGAGQGEIAEDARAKLAELERHPSTP